MKHKTSLALSCVAVENGNSQEQVQPTARTRKSTQYLAGGVATLAALSAGTLLSWSSPGLALLQQPSSIPQLSSEEASWVGSLLNIGALLGALPAGLLADVVGRRTTLLMSAPLLVVSWLLVALCSSTWELYFARLLGGVVVGAVSVVAPVYCAEVAESSIRGALGSFFQVQLSAGVLLGYVAGLVGHTTASLALILCVLPLLFLVAFPWVPETPGYLASRGRERDAVRALRWLRGPHCDALTEAKRLATAAKVGGGAPWWRLVLKPGTRRALLVVLGLMVFQQFSGVNAVIFYAEQILSIADGGVSANAASILVGAVQLAANYASVPLVDRAGRKVLLLVSAVVMSLSLGVLGTFFHLGPLVPAAVSGTVPSLCLASYVVAFSLGFGPVAWILLGELFPPEAKGPAAAAGAASCWLSSFVVTRTFSDMRAALGPGPTFWALSGVCLLAVPFVLTAVPETKGKDLAEIQEELAGRRDSGVHVDQDSET